MSERRNTSESKCVITDHASFVRLVRDVMSGTDSLLRFTPATLSWLQYIVEKGSGRGRATSGGRGSGRGRGKSTAGEPVRELQSLYHPMDKEKAKDKGLFAAKYSKDKSDA